MNFRQHTKMVPDTLVQMGIQDWADWTIFTLHGMDPNGAKLPIWVSITIHLMTIYLRFNEGGTAAVLVSNRIHKDKKKFGNTETCCDDIYLVQIRDLVIDLKALVNNEKGPLEGATIELFEGNRKTPADSKTNFLTNDFSFLLDADKTYTAIVTREGYYPDSISFNTNGIFDDYTVSKTITLKPKPEAPKRKVSRKRTYRIEEYLL